MDDPSIRKVVDAITSGRIRIPRFQRGFVWDPDRVAFFMDSLFKGYPFGSILFWRTRSKLNAERRLGPYELPDRDPDYPIDYVLDGQQRLTSIFGVFQTEMVPAVQSDWTPIYFDFAAGLDAQESQFVALRPGEVQADRHFPLNTLFDSASYRRATEGFDQDKAHLIDNVQAHFKEVILPVQTFETDERERVAIVFERVNRRGVELDTLELLSAWTWSQDFDLQDEFQDLTVTLEPFGFHSVGEDTNLLLRCCAAVIAGDASPTVLVSLRGSDVRARFPEIRNGILGAIDFLNGALHVHALKNLPFSTLLVPLAVFFAVEDGRQLRYNAEQRAELLRWFWKSCFTRRFSSGVLKNLKADIDRMTALRDDSSVKLFTGDVTIKPPFFLDNQFSMPAVNSKTFIMLLAQHQPLSFITGQPVSLREALQTYNRNEFHHMYPQKFLKGQDRSQGDINRLANLCFMSSADNRTIGGIAPSLYRTRLSSGYEARILSHALTTESLFGDDYDVFVTERAEILSTAANELMK